MAPKKKSGWLKWVVILLLLAGGVAGAMWYRNQPDGTAVDFKTATITRGDIIQVVTANGQLTPVKNVQVGSQISGIIKEIKADFNSKVAEGDVIAQIDPSTYEQNVDQAQAELLNSQAALEYAQINNKRTQDLLKERLIAASEADKTLADLHQAEAGVKIREAALKKSKVDLERTTIYAPISGIVISRNVDVGQTVAASFSTPTLFSIANDLTKMEINAMVSEADVGGVIEGQKTSFTVDAFPSRQFQGQVKQVRFAPTTNQNVVTYTTVVDVSNADLKLRPGMTANASIVTAERPSVLRIPNAALRFRPPESALLKTATNAPAASKGAPTNALANAEDASAPPAGEGGARPSREEMRKRFEGMTPEQQTAFRESRRSRSGAGDGTARNRPEGPATRMVYVLAKTEASTEKQPLAKAVSIKTGISDGAFTEVLDGLNEGDAVITGLNQPVTAAATAPPGGSSPFGRPFGGGGGGSGRPR